ncbi:adenosylhomocysteinase [Geotoga petraea]|jgi:adenosylhomocysteinase|uniref:Adenosylhomocysteinase n=1 Tax=Geotoga petraea TaxID=28234 RepID=A0A1G6JP98_9BACT|nr:adenosylhomocysteinase [Geotoga petraea]MDK2945404.1 adenosylhomocysteinase [Geotoga sp.]TGG88261.1 adenosylhomocysteinase [Geotoga petraea]SDC19776.1 adenosylhomocysteinase [Geotoga petraea]
MDLKKSGHQKIDWVKKYMKVINSIKEKYYDEKPFKGKKISMSIHLEAKTAYLAIILKQLGAEVSITGSNPLSTQPDVVEALKDYGLNVYAEKTLDEGVYWKNIDKVLSQKPDIIIDDGADLGSRYIEKYDTNSLLGICEETTTGVMRYEALNKKGSLKVPVIAVNNSKMKYLFDNRYGTGQSTWDGIIRSTNTTVTGKNVVVGGYGWCSRGIALRAKGLGANVIVTEVDPIKANEAIMDGFRVMKMDYAAPIGDIFVTATGDINIITKKHFRKMKDGAILANSGHFDVEVSVKDMKEIADSIEEIKPGVEEYKIDGKSLFLLAKGRLVNLVNGDGHPIEIMDLSFSLQLEAAKYLLENPDQKINVKPVPDFIDNKIARIKLETMGIEIDTLSKEQQKYLNKGI